MTTGPDIGLPRAAQELIKLEERIESGREFQTVGGSCTERARTENKISGRN